MKKRNRIIAGVVAFILIGLIIWFANGFVGNPVSKMLANKSAEKYIEATYPDMDLEINKAVYSFKDGGYSVFVELPTSLDINFSVNISPTGKVRWDSYESSVIGKFNTWRRVNSQYREIVEEVFAAENFPYESDIDFGEIKIINEVDHSFGPEYGVERKELVIDKIYDIKELGAKAGNLVYYIEDEIINAKRASEILLDLKNVFDEKDVPFYAINFTLQEPKINPDRKEFRVSGFRYSDIYEDGLVERLEQAASELEAYYEIEDGKKR